MAGWCLFLGGKTKKKAQLEQIRLVELKKRRQFGWKISRVASEPTMESLCILVDSVVVLIWWLVAEENMKDSREQNQT